MSGSATDRSGALAERAAGMAGLCRQHGLAIVYAFGSRAREVRDWSAGDRAAQLSGPSDVDLVVLPEADPFLAAEIIRGERVFSRDEYEADEYDLYVLRRAGDLIPLERERMALIMQGQQ